VLHGGGGTGKYMATLTGFNRLAASEGFIAVYPEAEPTDRRWNDGRTVQKYRSQRENIDDVGFISAVIDRLAAEYPIDFNRVYVTGISNGAMMTHRLAVDIADKIAAAAMVTGNIPEEYFNKGIPRRPVPMLIMNGTDDPLMPWNGGAVKAGRRDLGQVISTPQTVDFWRTHNCCQGPAQVTYKADSAPGDGTRVRLESYKNSAGRVMVILYAVEGGGHTWPGGPQYIPEAVVGTISFDIDGSDEIYNFFKKHSRQK
jgi:polyhydroxybutyrate depolymerase